ncbi:MAG TPA: DUF6602 domain-containing protein [Anaerolineae bacterium]|nr:DUF6602 domain-containing protein [Anaerolineae bacterium]
MDITQIFRGIANKLLADFDQIQAQIEHSGERGGQREAALRAFLTKYLPKKYALGTGHIIDKTGNTSKQCDIVIYDAFNCPLILAEEGYQLFPAEAVFGVVEVKSVLDAGAIAEGVQNIQSVKILERSEPIAGSIFAYRSRYRKRSRIESAAHALRRKNTSIRPRERVDLVCILTDGLLLNYKTEPHWGEGEEGSALIVCVDVTPSILLLFLFWLIEILKERHSSMPNLVGYASRGEIGIVKMLSPAEGENLVMPPLVEGQG